MELRFTVETKIQKPVAEVFDAVHNPDKISQYFATGGASGPLDEGSEVIWRFADYPGDAPVRVKLAVANERIAMEWDAGVDGAVCRVEMTFEQLDNGSTLVSISESGWPATQKGLELSYGNCHGWTQMSCALKAWLEYGINLRKGFY